MATPDSDICYLTATEALTAFKAKTLSPVDLMQAIIARCEAVNPKVNAITYDFYERALKLNPNHYGAWQGLGVCQLKLGDLAGACKSLRAALGIAPHDKSTRESLEHCEELLRPHRQSRKADRAAQLI